MNVGVIADTSSYGRAAVRRYDHAFYTAMSLAAVAAVVVGFAPSYYFKAYFRPAPLRPLVHLHGAVFTGWILLFLAQTVLIASRRVHVHRRLGWVGAGWAAAVVGVGLTTAIVSARRGFPADHSGTLQFLAVPLTDMLVFMLLVAAGIRYRPQPEVHKRLMLLATIGILDAAVARWPLAMMSTGPLAFFGITDLFIVACVMYDLASRRRVHPAYIWGGLLLVASQPLRLSLARTDLWMAFAGMLIR